MTYLRMENSSNSAFSIERWFLNSAWSIEDIGEPVCCNQSFISFIFSSIPCILYNQFQSIIHYTPQTVPFSVFIHQPTKLSLVACSWVYLRNHTPIFIYQKTMETLNLSKDFEIQTNQLSQCCHSEFKSKRIDNKVIMNWSEHSSLINYAY